MYKILRTQIISEGDTKREVVPGIHRNVLNSEAPLKNHFCPPRFQFKRCRTGHILMGWMTISEGDTKGEVVPSIYNINVLKTKTPFREPSCSPRIQMRDGGQVSSIWSWLPKGLTLEIIGKWREDLGDYRNDLDDWWEDFKGGGRAQPPGGHASDWKGTKLGNAQPAARRA